MACGVSALVRSVEAGLAGYDLEALDEADHVAAEVRRWQLQTVGDGEAVLDDTFAHIPHRLRVNVPMD